MVKGGTEEQTGVRITATAQSCQRMNRTEHSPQTWITMPTTSFVFDYSVRVSNAIVAESLEVKIELKHVACRSTARGANLGRAKADRLKVQYIEDCLWPRTVDAGDFSVMLRTADPPHTQSRSMESVRAVEVSMALLSLQRGLRTKHQNRKITACPESRAKWGSRWAPNQGTMWPNLITLIRHLTRLWSISTSWKVC